MRIGSGLFRLLDLRRDVHGLENVPPAGGAVLAVTHFGYLDFALVQDEVWRRHRRLTRFLVTDVAFAHRIAGPLLRAMRHIPVHRAAGAGAYRSARAALGRGELVGIFPESAVSVTTELLPLKKGAAGLAARDGCAADPGAGLGRPAGDHQRHPAALAAGPAMPRSTSSSAPRCAPHRAAIPIEVTAELRAVLTTMIAALVAVAPERSHENVLRAMRAGRPRRGGQLSERTNSRKTAASSSASSVAASPVNRSASSGPSARTTSASVSSTSPSSSSTETASA